MTAFLGVTLASLLKKKNLAEFEIASLANLLPETPEEAKALLPTLRKFDDDELQSILNELANLRMILPCF